MKSSIPFPKDDPLFSSDAALMNKIKGIEDRIELRYQSLQLQNALLPLVRLYEEPQATAIQSAKMDPKLLKALTELAMPNNQKPRRRFDIDRENIDEMKRRQGTLYVLGLLSPRLMTSMELLFAGIVTLYIQMFNGSKGRHVLVEKSIYEDGELLYFHQHILKLRNEHYAHMSSGLGRHNVSYILDEKGDIHFDIGGPHQDVNFHSPERCRTLYQCLDCVICYLDAEIEKNSRKIISALTNEQLEMLKNQLS